MIACAAFQYGQGLSNFYDCYGSLWAPLWILRIWIKVRLYKIVRIVQSCTLYIYSYKRNINMHWLCYYVHFCIRVCLYGVYYITERSVRWYYGFSIAAAASAAAFAAKRHLIVSPKSSKCNISISNGPIAFKFYTEVKNLKLHKKMSMTRLTPKLHSLTTLVSPKSSKCNISMNNGPIALKFCTEVQSQ